MTCKDDRIYSSFPLFSQAWRKTTGENEYAIQDLAIYHKYVLFINIPRVYLLQAQVTWSFCG